MEMCQSGMAAKELEKKNIECFFCFDLFFPKNRGDRWMFLTLTPLVFLTVFAARGCLFGACSGEYIVDLFANNLETSFITNDEEILTMVWEVDNTVPDLRVDCGVPSQTSPTSHTSQCDAAFPYIVSANTSDVAANQGVVDVTIRNARCVVFLFVCFFVFLFFPPYV